MSDSPLRIAQIAPLATPVTPETCHSIEHMVYVLTEALVRRGHEVTLFATGDSSTSARLCARYRRGYNDDADLWNWRLHESMHVAAAFERADEFDIIHSHDYEFALPYTGLVRTPVVHTYHILPDLDVLRAFARAERAHVVAISDYQRSCVAEVPDVEVVHHGEEIETFPWSAQPGAYLLFLGRVIPEKGPLQAIQLAMAAGMPLKIAGPVGSVYYEDEIAALVDGSVVEYVGPVDRPERDRLLSGAAALLYPLHVPEAFGLVMIEAMACGTPVLALNVGSVPEIVDWGETGYYADDIASLLQYFPQALELPRARIRAVAAARFSVERMAEDYERLYRRVATDSVGLVS